MWSLIWVTIVAVSSAKVTVATQATRARQNLTIAEDETPENATIHEVDIDQIIIRGNVSENIVQYFDIPYGLFSAESPFQNPSSFPTGQTLVIENTAHTSRCPQIDSANTYIGNHNCLTLSIFVPVNAQNADVLFHIHDSSGNTGSGDPSVYGPRHLASQGIILVLPNYRIGALGFLCPQNEAAPGNAGLKDLHLALEWTHKYINLFGGNESNIAISGSGFGGALVEYLLLSKESRKFISKAITESGSALAPWALDRNPDETVKNLEIAVNQTENSPATVNTYTSLGSDLEKLVRAARGFDMAPCVESNQTGFLTQTPWQILNHENFEITLMIGSANYAAMDKVSTQTEQTWSHINNDNSLLLPNDLKFNSVNDKNNIARKIRTKYFGGLNITSNDERRLLKCYSDSHYLYPGIRGARLLVRRGATIYFYEFSKRINSGGSGRGDSLNEVFSKDNTEETPIEANTLEEGTREHEATMLTLWTSFIKEGKPSAEGVNWTNLRAVGQPDQEVWLSIGDTMRVKRGFHGDRLQLWDAIYRNHFIERPGDMIARVVLVHLFAYGVVGRTPTIPLAMYKDVMTTQGTVRGYYAPHPRHYAFLGIPYARPPTRYDRFKSPKPPSPWSGIFEATHRIKCLQPDGSGEENCLVVNVFAPDYATSLPVIVHFHDGGFQKGWGSFQAPLKFLERSFVFVTFNYRIGVLGFLCLGTEEITGNAGLKDQVAALYWVQKNIARFGGNPSDVTVYGTGSGAVSIEIILLSGLKIDFFQKAILESGSVLSPTSISIEPIAEATNFAESLGVESTGPNAFKEIYRLPAKILLNTSYIFLPCIEKQWRSSHSIINEDPRDIFRNKKYQQVPMMIVYGNAEEVAVISDDNERFKTIPNDFQDLLPNNLNFDDEDTKRKVAQLVKDFYFDEIELADNVIRSYIDYINDLFIEYPVVKSTTHYAYNGNSVFLMKFLYKSNLSYNKNKNIPGAGSGDVYLYLNNNEYLGDDHEMVVERLVTLWSNFIKLGDPTPLTSPLIPEIWQPVITHTVDREPILRNIPCLFFNGNMRNEILSGQQYTFWDRIYDKFYINTTEKFD